MPAYSIGTDRPWMPKGELDCAEADFSAHIHQGDSNGHSTIGHAAFEIRVSAFMARINALAGHQSGGHVNRAVFVHYGLNDQNELDIALEFVKLTYDGNKDDYTFVPDSDYYRPLNGQLAKVAGGFSAWYTAGKPGERYARMVMIRPTSDPDWRPFDIGTDAYASVQAFETVLHQLLVQNNAQESHTLRIVPIALPTERTGGFESGFHQSDAWYIVESPPDDTDYGIGHEFELKSADLSGCCPPNGVRLRFADQGLARKTGCTP